MITVYGRATSSNVQAVMWGIAELGLAHASGSTTATSTAASTRRSSGR